MERMNLDEDSWLGVAEALLSASLPSARCSARLSATPSPARDVFALLPTGGGKSLCFQLPALIRPGLTVVVSPLIALMKDQVDALQAAGIAATFLNSSLGRRRVPPAPARPCIRHEYRLLYAAPERLMLSGFLDDLQSWNVNLIAVDEAHCISEWGHDFRPEYRQLSQLRPLFPGVPMMALTATATARVREDIVKLLHLREPSRFVASFNRPNLTYRVIAKAKPAAQVLDFLRARPRESGIIYCQSRKGAESAGRPTRRQHGIPARPYHAGLTAARAQRKPGTFPARRSPRHLRDHRLRHGHQQTQRPLRHPLRPAQEHRRLLPGNRPRRPRRLARRMPPAFQRRRRRQATALHRGKTARTNSASPANNCSKSSITPIPPAAAAPNCSRYFGETFPTDNCGGCDNCL